VALRLHEFARRIAALSDIEEIVTAMRSLAFVELRRLIETIAHQSETTAARERAIGQLLDCVDSAFKSRAPRLH